MDGLDVELGAGEVVSSPPQPNPLGSAKEKVIRAKKWGRFVFISPT
jgi:hypothetical protein